MTEPRRNKISYSFLAPLPLITLKTHKGQKQLELKFQLSDTCEALHLVVSAFGLRGPYKDWTCSPQPE